MGENFKADVSGVIMVDVAAQIANVTRELSEQPVDGHASYVQTLTQEYPVSIAELWRALTDGDLIASWFLPVSGSLQLGGRYQFEGNAGGEVLACEQPANGRAAFAATWEFGGGVTWVHASLESLDEQRTRLRFEHVARVNEVPAELWEQFGPGATGVGWDGGLLGLALHLGATAGTLSPAEAEAWGQTDEGKAFYRGAADGWAAAHITAGASAAAAARAADATFGFYTGSFVPPTDAASSDSEAAGTPSIVERPEQHLAVVREIVSLEGVAALYDRAFPLVFEALSRAGVVPSGPPMGVVHGAPSDTLDLSVAIPVAEPFTPTSEVAAETLPAARCATLVVRGDYSELGAAYQRLFGWVAEQGLTAAGVSWEQYLTEPEPGGDPAQNVTLLGVPLA